MRLDICKFNERAYKLRSGFVAGEPVDRWLVDQDLDRIDLL